MCGTLSYMPPESLGHVPASKWQSSASDVWAVGVTMYELRHQKPLFPDGVQSRDVSTLKHLHTKVTGLSL